MTFSGLRFHPLTLHAAALALALNASAVAQKPTATPQPQATDSRSSSYYHYGLARMYEDMAAQAGRQDYATQAIEEYKLALDGDPHSRQLQDGLANLYFRLGRIREAVSAAQEQTAQHPDDVAAHLLLGRVYLRALGGMQGQPSEDILKLAIAEYETITRLKPDDLEARLLLGQLYGLNHDSARAEQQFKEAQRIDDASEEVVLSMARLYSEQRQLDKAIAVLTAVAPDNRSARMEFALGGLYDSIHKNHEAASAYRRALDKDPDNADDRRALANALLADGQLDEAGKFYAALVDADPQDAASVIRLADTQRLTGHYDDSLATLKKAQAITSDNPELPYSLALTYDSLGRFSEAQKALRDILTATEHSDGKYSEAERANRVVYLDRLAIIQREAGDTAGAVASYQQIAALGADFAPRAADGTVEAYRDAHQWTQALAAATSAAHDQPSNREAQLKYATQLADNGKLDEGLALVAKLRTGTPDDREIFLTLADMDIRAKRWKDASAQIDKADAISSAPEEKQLVAFYRGTLAERQKLYDEAELQFRKALALDPTNTATLNYLGYMLADRGIKLTGALALVQQAVKLDPQNGAFLDSLGWCYFKLGQTALAEETLRQAVARSAGDPTVSDHLAEVYARNGKLKLAIAQWQHSVDEYKTSLPPEADPADVARVERKLETARVKLAHANFATPAGK